jgi:histone acetyltransferase (RNA polymerase elongator complex component)
MKKRPLVIPIFIPQEGCRHRCIYCDQHTISGVSPSSWNPASIRRHVQGYLDNSSRSPVQVAFYGGSFTFLSVSRQRLFLEAVREFLEQDRVCSLRLSTRPDGIAEKNLDFLQTMGVETIELGAQSLHDPVLAAAGRGHSSKDTYEAATRVKKHGFELGLQLMPGLPGDTRDIFGQTVSKVIDLKPSFVRLYPTVVLSSTPLERLYRNGRYKPLNLKEAVDWCKEAKKQFDEAGISVVRIGLQPTTSLEQPGRVVAGPYHPAFGQLVNSSLWSERITPVLRKLRPRSSRFVILAPWNQLADIRGQRNYNIKRWLAELNLTSLKTIASAEMAGQEFAVTTGRFSPQRAQRSHKYI